MSFDALVDEALAQQFSGWCFDFVAGRMVEMPPPWSFEAEVQRLVGDAGSMLDMGTGGGERLASMTRRAPSTVATEGFEPNIEIAHSRLAPLGVSVVGVRGDQPLPFADASYDLVVNRHEQFDAGEVARILRPGGWFCTQQVGGRNLLALNAYLGAHGDPPAWSLEHALRSIGEAGLRIDRAVEAFPETRFTDIGAVVFYLLAIPWQVPAFNFERDQDKLRRLHAHIEEHGAFECAAHRFIVLARKAGGDDG